MIDSRSHLVRSRPQRPPPLTRDREHIPRMHRFGNWVISGVFSALFGVKITDVCSGMYLLETKEAKKYSLQETGFNIEIELAAQSASRENLTEVPINYRSRIGERKLSTWRNGLSILRAAFTLARRYNPILLYSALTGLSIIPAAVVLGWVAHDFRIVGGYGLLARPHLPNLRKRLRACSSIPRALGCAALRHVRWRTM